MIRLEPFFAVAVFAAIGRAAVAASPLSAAARPPVPVILDTDIGDDMDDSWALVMLLKSPQFDLRLITTTNGRQAYRADLIAKFLTLARRTDVPIGLGEGTEGGAGGQAKWLQPADRGAYAGPVTKDGVGALIEVIQRSPVPVTVIGIGPMQTLAAAVERDPSIAVKANLVAMLGSVRMGYEGSPEPVAEYNVRIDPAACRKVLAAPWRHIAFTPVDTSGLPGVKVEGTDLAACRRSHDPLLHGLLASFDVWRESWNRTGVPLEAPAESSRLFDTVAIYLADPQNCPLLKQERLNIAVSPEGMTIVDPAGLPANVATAWTDLPAFRAHLASVLFSTTVRK